MIINISHIKQADLLVDATKNSDINWINVEILKSYLRKSEKSLNTVQILHEYLIHLQNEKFIFDCSETYLSLFENTLFAFAKGKYSYTYRLDCIELEETTIEWKKNKVPTNMLLRIRNAINIVSSITTEELCENLLTTISSDILV